MRPRSIVYFERILFSILVLGTANGILNWRRSNELLAAQPELGRYWSGYLAFLIFASALLYLSLWYFIARRRSVLAKWIFMAGVAANVLNRLPRLVRGELNPVALEVLSDIVLLLFIVAAWLLFRPDAKTWFEKREAVDPEIFR
ncbi:MAG TPA: hypothetical protein VEW71_07390 [Allosphingosinicella sp.]|nr:hypothetical protein [Allosphingosinicella sp.]